MCCLLLVVVDVFVVVDVDVVAATVLVVVEVTVVVEVVVVVVVVSVVVQVVVFAVVVVDVEVVDAVVTAEVLVVEVFVIVEVVVLVLVIVEVVARVVVPYQPDNLNASPSFHKLPPPSGLRSLYNIPLSRCSLPFSALTCQFETSRYSEPSKPGNLVGALAIIIGFWNPINYKYNKEPS